MAQQSGLTRSRLDHGLSQKGTTIDLCLFSLPPFPYGTQETVPLIWIRGAGRRAPEPRADDGVVRLASDEPHLSLPGAPLNFFGGAGGDGGGKSIVTRGQREYEGDSCEERELRWSSLSCHLLISSWWGVRSVCFQDWFSFASRRVLHILSTAGT